MTLAVKRYLGMAKLAARHPFAREKWRPSLHLPSYMHTLSGNLERIKWNEVGNAQKQPQGAAGNAKNQDYFSWVAAQIPDFEADKISYTLYHDIRSEKISRDCLNETRIGDTKTSRDIVADMRFWHNQAGKNQKAAYNLILELFAGEIIYLLPAMRTRAEGGRELSGTVRGEIATLMDKVIQFKLEDIYFDTKDLTYKRLENDTGVVVKIEKNKRNFREKFMLCCDVAAESGVEATLRERLHSWAGWDIGAVEKLPPQEQSLFALALAIAWSIKEMTQDLAVLRASVLTTDEIEGDPVEKSLKDLFGDKMRVAEIKLVRFFTRNELVDSLYTWSRELFRSVEKFDDITGEKIRFQSLSLLEKTTIGFWENAKLAYNHLTETKAGKVFFAIGAAMGALDFAFNALDKFGVTGWAVDFFTGSTFSLIVVGFVVLMLEQIPRIKRRMGFAKSKKATYS